MGGTDTAGQALLRVGAGSVEPAPACRGRGPQGPPGSADHPRPTSPGASVSGHPRHETHPVGFPGSAHSSAGKFFFFFNETLLKLPCLAVPSVSCLDPDRTLTDSAPFFIYSRTLKKGFKKTYLFLIGG